MGNATKGLEPQNRPITAKERGLIDWLLRHCDPGSDQLLSQIDALTVTWKCTCGCPTIYFEIPDMPRLHEPEHILADFLATADGNAVGVLLFQRGGRLSSLEVYSLGGTDKPFGLPEIETLRSW